VPIRSPHDIGWIADLTVGRLMRRDARTVPAALPLAELRVRFPAGQDKYLFVLDERARYAGAIDLAEAHATELDERLASLVAGDLARARCMSRRPTKTSASRCLASSPAGPRSWR